MLVFYPNTAVLLYTPWYRCPKMTLFLPETNPQSYLSMTGESVLVCVFAKSLVQENTTPAQGFPAHPWPSVWKHIFPPQANVLLKGKIFYKVTAASKVMCRHDVTYLFNTFFMFFLIHSHIKYDFSVQILSGPLYFPLE